MSGGNGGSGGGGGVRGDGGARAFGPQEPQTPGFQGGRISALAPGLAVRRAREAAAGGATEGGVGFWMGTCPLGLWLAGVYCDCIAEGVGGGQRVGLGEACDTHPDLRGWPRCRCAP